MNTTETPTGKRLNQFSAAEMAWWHKNAFQPTAGKSYLCRRGCKEHGTTTGKVYVFDGSNLKHYSRHVTILLNGYNILRQAYAFEETDSVAEPANALSVSLADDADRTERQPPGVTVERRKDSQ